MKELDAKEFKENYQKDEKAVLIDVRSPEEEIDGKIENSINLNIMEQAFPARIMDLDKSKNYYVYCRSGARSATACQFMERQGFYAVNLRGGIIAWKEMNNEC